MALYKTYSKDQKKCAVTFELTPEAANGLLLHFHQEAL